MFKFFYVFSTLISIFYGQTPSNHHYDMAGFSGVLPENRIRVFVSLPPLSAVCNTMTRTLRVVFNGYFYCVVRRRSEGSVVSSRIQDGNMFQSLRYLKTHVAARVHDLTRRARILISPFMVHNQDMILQHVRSLTENFYAPLNLTRVLQRYSNNLSQYECSTYHRKDLLASLSCK